MRWPSLVRWSCSAGRVNQVVNVLAPRRNPLELSCCNSHRFLNIMADFLHLTVELSCWIMKAWFDTPVMDEVVKPPERSVGELCQQTRFGHDHNVTPLSEINSANV